MINFINTFFPIVFPYAYKKKNSQIVILSTKSQHNHITSKCTEFDGGSEFSQQIMILVNKKSTHL